MKLNEQYGLPDWGESDGIGECEAIIIAAGGKVSQNGIITFPNGVPDKEFVNEAIIYLVDEWDYFLEKS